MAFTPGLTNTFFLLAIVVVFLPVETYAFGAGDIPDFAYLNDKAFRHGDIENILETLVKSAGGAAVLGGSGLLGFASSVIKKASGGSKFTKSDVQKVYFGNWLRDYSQAMDIAGLSKLSADTLVLVVAVLGFMTFGFASEEFEVTADRLGVYLPVEHIDNPKGYAEKEGDARSFHPKLRPPVSPRELEIDDRTGMKKYIATENQGWDTSTAFIRRTFRACIEAGRRANGRESADLWEAYRLLGTGLHTMEDLLAHSNWCEISLRKMGHRDVFCHVGDRVTVNTPNGPAPPLVTGTFGSADFLHSLLGEAGDKLSQASVTDLSQKMSNSSSDGPDISALKGIFSKFGGGDEKLDQGEEIKKQSQAYHFDPDNICPPEVQQQLLELLKWHDDILRTIIKKIEMIPGLSNLLDEFSNSLNEYIYTILAPYLGPILTQATSVLNEGSKAVIDTDDQYEVFNNPHAHDPSHSLLSKDHFGLILNEPAGKIAQLVVENSVNLIVPAWSDDTDADQVIDQILEAFHHPYYATGRSEIQEKMFDHMQRWLGGLGSEAQEILDSLTKESVRDHKNKRPGLNETEEPGYGGCGHGYTPSKKPSGGNSTGYSSQTAYAASGYGSTQSQSHSSYDSSNTYGHGRTDTSTGGYGIQRRGDDDDREGYNEAPKYGREDTPVYGGRTQRYDDAPAYGGQSVYGGREEGYGVQSAYGTQRRDETSTYGGQETPSYGEQPGGYAPSYGQPQPAFGGHNRDDDDSRGHHGRKPQRDDDDEPRYGAKRDDFDDERKYKATESRHVGGGGYGEGRYDTSSYGRSKQDDSDDDGERKRHGKHGGRRDDDDRPSYGQSSYGGNEPGGYTPSYGGRGDDNDQPSYGQPRPAYGGNNPGGYTPSYGQSGYGGNTSGGYAPSYGGRDETFGAENLNIGRGGDDSDEDRRRHEHHGHGGRHHGEGRRYD